MHGLSQHALSAHRHSKTSCMQGFTPAIASTSRDEKEEQRVFIVLVKRKIN